MCSFHLAMRFFYLFTRFSVAHSFRLVMCSFYLVLQYFYFIIFSLQVDSNCFEEFEGH